MQHWKTIAETTDEFKAQLYYELLQSEKIEVVLLNKKDSMYNIGVVEIKVPDHQALIAKYILEKHGN